MELSVEDEVNLYIEYQKKKRPVNDETHLRPENEVREIKWWVARKLRDLMDCKRIVSWKPRTLEYCELDDSLYVYVQFHGEEDYKRVGG